MSTRETKLPYGVIRDKKLIMQFSAYDMDLPIIAAGIRERTDVMKELDVAFSGFGTEVPEKMTEQTPAVVKAFFEYVGKETDSDSILKRVYHLVWEGMLEQFPDLADWAAAKADLANLTFAQADVIRARKGD
jgi:hypothetical protein